MIQELIFLLFAGVVLGFGVLAVTLKNIFHAALCFAVSMFGISGIFIFLGSEFVAVVQLLVYLGAVGVLIIFAIMISPPDLLRAETKSISKLFFCLSASVALAVVLTALYLKSPLEPIAKADEGIALAKIGELLLTKYIFPFEVIALVLLLAIIGSIFHAWSGMGDDS